MNPNERRFAVLLSSSHGLEHFLRRLFPPLIPIWVVTLDFPLALAGLLLGVQSLGSATGQIPFGVLADRHDRRFMLPTGLAIAAAFVAVFAVVPFLPVVDVDLTVVGRSVGLPILVMLVAMYGIGLGGSVLHPAGYPLISENVATARKGTAYGAWGSAAKLGDGLSPAVVGVLLLVLPWQEVLLGLGTLAVGYSVFLFVVLGEFETRPAAELEREDAAADDEPAPEDRGAASDAGRGPDTSRSVTGPDRRIYLYPLLAIFVFFTVRVLAVGGVNVFIPEFITSEYGYAFDVAGVAVTPASTASFYYSALLVVAGVVQLGTGRLVDRFDARLVVVAMLVVATALLLAMALAVLSPLALLVVLLALGGSLWALNPARDALVSAIAPATREGRTFGYLFTGSAVAGAVSPVVVGYIGDVVGLRTAFALVAMTTLFAAVPVLLLFSDRVWRPPSERSGAGDGGDA